MSDSEWFLDANDTPQHQEECRKETDFDILQFGGEDLEFDFEDERLLEIIDVPPTNCDKFTEYPKHVQNVFSIPKSSLTFKEIP